MLDVDVSAYQRRTGCNPGLQTSGVWSFYVSWQPGDRLLAMSTFSYEGTWQLAMLALTSFLMAHGGKVQRIVLLF